MPEYLTILLIFFLLGVIVLLISVLIFQRKKIKKEGHARADADARFKALEEKVNSLQLENLESKLNPHLFKNVLNSIQSHAYQTYYSIDKLANVLDYVLYESRNKLVTPKEEIEFALNLIEINKIKVSPLFELKVKQKVNEFEPLFNQRILAPLISVDLIENAFKHADLQSPDSFISVIFQFKDNAFSLTVSNRISARQALKKEKSGLGSEILENRLRIIYKNNFKLEKFIDDNVFTAHLNIDLFEYQNKMHTAG